MGAVRVSEIAGAVDLVRLDLVEKLDDDADMTSWLRPFFWTLPVS